MGAETRIDTPLAKLREPFPPNLVSKLPKETRRQIDERKDGKNIEWKCAVCGGMHHKNAVHLDYVGHAALTDRLLDTDLEWSWEPVAFNAEGLPAFDRNGGLWIRLTVAGVTRLGYGSADGKQGGDAVKEMIGDALRNAAMRFGAALDLWHKGDLHAEDEATSDAPAGQSQDGAVSPPERWSEPDSPLSGISKLKAALKRLDRELESCGDSDMVYALTGTEEWREFVKIANKHAPHYLHGGEPAPAEFEGIVAKAERLVAEFDSAQAQHMADIARA